MTDNLHILLIISKQNNKKQAQSNGNDGGLIKPVSRIGVIEPKDSIELKSDKNLSDSNQEVKLDEKNC